MIIDINTFEISLKIHFDQRLVTLSREFPKLKLSIQDKSRKYNFDGTELIFLKRLYELYPENKDIIDLSISTIESNRSSQVSLLNKDISLTLKTYTLLEHQVQAINFAIQNDGRCIIADEMGSGKTLIALSYATLNNERTLIICPKSIVGVWHSEIEKTGLDTNLFKIITYQAISKLTETEISSFGLAILDESHYIKNYKSKRTKETLKVVKQINKRILLTGTPLLNNVSDLYTQISLVRPKEYKNFWEFADLYIPNLRRPKQNRNLDDLSEILSQFTLRRTKDQILNLPQKQRIDVSCEKRVRFRRESTDNNILQILNRAKRESAESKIANTIELADIILENNESVVIFSEFTSVCEAIKERFKDDCIHLESKDSSQIRTQKINEFQSTNRKIFVSTIQLGNAGITLTAASKIIFNDLTFSGGMYLQAEDRIHRVSQTNACTIYRMTSRSDIDVALISYIDTKILTLAKVMKDKNYVEEYIDIYDKLIKTLKEKFNVED